MVCGGYYHTQNAVGGGGNSTSGEYSVSDTIGQPEEGAMGGGSYSVVGGGVLNAWSQQLPSRSDSGGESQGEERVQSGALKPPKATPKPYTRHILGSTEPLQSPTKAPPKPHQCDLKATLEPGSSEGTRMACWPWRTTWEFGRWSGRQDAALYVRQGCLTLRGGGVRMRPARYRASPIP